MQHFDLSNGVRTPALGFGVFQIDDLALCEQCVYDALMAGYRLLDTASAYCNEEAVGAAVRRAAIPRDELFVTTKIWVQEAGYEGAMAAFERSLGKLGLDYIDLYLIHRPFGDYYGSWRAMEELYRAGRIRAIGVSNFTVDRLIDLAYHNEITPMVNQIETHPFHQRGAEREVMDELGIRHQAWAPFAEGANNIFGDEVLASIGEKHRKTNAQVILRWQLQRGTVAIPKSVRKERIVENFDIWDFALDAEDLSHIAQMDLGRGLFKNQITDPNTVKHWCTVKFHE